MEFLYRRLVNAHKRQVYALAYRILDNVSEAEDVTQEVYEKLWQNIRRIDEEDAGAWLKHVCRNLCIDRLRKHRNSEELNESHEATTGHSLMQSVHFGRLSAWLQKAVAALKEPYRSIVILSDLQECSQREIAVKCELSEQQVKVYLHRARKRLRESLRGIEL